MNDEIPNRESNTFLSKYLAGGKESSILTHGYLSMQVLSFSYTGSGRIAEARGKRNVTNPSGVLVH